MAHFPNTFAETIQPLTLDLGDRGNEARERLAEKGFVVVSGLTKELATQVQEIAQQPHIREFCPNDSTKRFSSLETIERWLSKQRGTFLLGREIVEQEFQVFGYGWTGPATCDEIPHGRTTFAVRIAEQGRGNQAGTDFSKVIVAGSAALHGAQDIWLETWNSNRAAVSAYEKVGFEYVSEQPSTRPTLDAVSFNLEGNDYVLREREDNRLFMDLPNALLPQAA